MSTTTKFTCALDDFPSQNKLNAMGFRARLAEKKRLRERGQYAGMELMKGKKGKRPYFKNPVSVTLVAFFPDKRMRDIHNLSLKHFLDGLTLAGVLKDDNIIHVPRAVYEFGGYDRDYPRVELTLEEI